MAAGTQAGMAMAVTQIATAVAALTWTLVEWAMRGKPTLVGICTGTVAGLVAITPASGFVGPTGSMAIGVAAGIACYWGCTGLKHIFGYDDALDAFGVHAIGGAVAAILIEGKGAQVVNQIAGVAIVLVYDVVVSLVILKLIGWTIGLRVTEDEETEGLDLTLHGEAVQ